MKGYMDQIWLVECVTDKCKSSLNLTNRSRFHAEESAKEKGWHYDAKSNYRWMCPKCYTKTSDA